MSRRLMLRNESGVEPEKGWEDGVKYDWSTGLVPNVYILTSNGQEAAYNGWSASDFLPCNGVKTLVRGSFMTIYNAFYDENKNYIRPFRIDGNNTTVAVPQAAYYFRVSDETKRMNDPTMYYLIPYSE